MIYLNENRESVRAYRMKDDKRIIQDQLEVFQDVVSNLAGASAGLRVEYLEGY